MARIDTLITAIALRRSWWHKWLIAGLCILWLAGIAGMVNAWGGCIFTPEATEESSMEDDLSQRSDQPAHAPEDGTDSRDQRKGENYDVP